jgi:3'(2'), 5'-bisphosphate nucleotidase
MIDFEPVFTAVRQAAALCRAVQARYLPADGAAQAATKAGAEPVTMGDYGVQAILCRAISRAYPDDAVIAEESGRQFYELIADADREEIAALVGEALGERVRVDDMARWLDHGQGQAAAHTWVIDPIDGTKGFLARRHYVIALGVLRGGQPVAGVIGAPAYPNGGAIFAAQKGAASVQPLAGGPARRIAVSQRTDPAALIVVESVEKSHASRDLMARVREAAGIGAAAVEQYDSQEKYARIAAGDADLYLRLPRLQSTRPHMIWDHAAGAALVLHAGGIVTDVDGSPLDFTQGRTLAKNQGIIVANPRIHAQVVQAAQSVQP